MKRIEDLGNNYESFEELKLDIEQVQVPKKPFSSKKILYSEKIIAFLFSHMISFERTKKVKGIPLSKKFIENIKSVIENTYCIHHLHVTGEIQGYAQTFCNEKGRENYFRIPVIAHNLFRFDFFLLLKVLRAAVWKTRGIVIGGKNPTDVNFASIGNQVRFLNTVKYYQQSLAALASSLTDE